MFLTSRKSVGIEKNVTYLSLENQKYFFIRYFRAGVVPADIMNIVKLDSRLRLSLLHKYGTYGDKNSCLKAQRKVVLLAQASIQ